MTHENIMTHEKCSSSIFIDKEVNICHVKDINWNELYNKNKCRYRAGVIVYTIHNDDFYFCLGVDVPSGELTDFGGGVESKDKSPIHGGLREFKEESLGIFGNITANNVKNSVVVYSNNMLIMFLRLVVNIPQKNKLFRIKVSKIKKPEISHIFWLSTQKFVESIKGTGLKMYNKVAVFLSKANDLFNYL